MKRNQTFLAALGLAAGLAPLPGCGEACLDDGLGQRKKCNRDLTETDTDTDGQGTGTGTDSETDGETGNTGSTGETDGSETTGTGSTGTDGTAGTESSGSTGETGASGGSTGGSTDGTDSSSSGGSETGGTTGDGTTGGTTGATTTGDTTGDSDSTSGDTTGTTGDSGTTGGTTGASGGGSGTTGGTDSDSDGDSTGTDSDSGGSSPCAETVTLEIDAAQATLDGWGSAPSGLDQGDQIFPETPDGTATFNLDLECGDTWHIWVRGWEQGGADSFRVNLDDLLTEPAIFDLDCTDAPPGEGAYTWAKLNRRADVNACGVDTPWEPMLDAGMYPLVFLPEDAQAISRIIITNDPGLTPP